MSPTIANHADDDLIRLWQDTVLPTPDPAQLAHRVAGMAVRRFDRAVLRRNAREYAGSLLAVFFAGVQWMATGDHLQAVALVVAVAFISGVLWWQQRRVPPLDPSADARTYQAALVARMDQQIRLLGTVRYWYLLPLYIPAIIQAVNGSARHPVGAWVVLGIVTAIFAFIAWLNERLGVAFLKQERARVVSLYEDDAA
jgi:hypothetical protein